MLAVDQQMKGLLRILALIVATSVVLAIFTEYKPGTLDAQTEVLGLPVVSVAQVGAHGWLAMGQVAGGVLVIAQGGVGVVALTQGGVGLVFGVGQLMFSSVTIGQMGVGLFGFLGQVGVGAQAIGQGVWRRRSREYFAELSREVDELLSWRSPTT
jgi:hypothetical protein